MTTQPTSPASPATSRSSTKSRQRLVLVLVVVALVALVTWLVTRGDDGDEPSVAEGVKVGVPTILSEADLRKFARAQKRPVYWAGPLPNRRYELTRTANDRYFIRYLTPRAKAGDGTPRFLSVGTYPGTNAYGALAEIGRARGTSAIQTQSGALVVIDKARPTSVYFAFPNQQFQVEVFDPRPSRARKFVLDGRVERLR